MAKKTDNDIKKSDKNKTRLAVIVLIAFMALCTGVVSMMNFGIEDGPSYSVYAFDATSPDLMNNMSGYVEISANNMGNQMYFENRNAIAYSHSTFCLRRGPGVYFESDRNLYYGEEVILKGISSSGWAKVEAGGVEGYVIAASLSYNAPAPRTITDDYGLLFNIVNKDAYVTRSYYVRTGPGTTFDILDTLEVGDEVHLFATSFNGWNIIEYDGSYAYVYGDCVVAAGEDDIFYYGDVKVALTNSEFYLNADSDILSSPDDEPEVIGSVIYGQKVHVIGICNNGYFLIETSAGTGYVDGNNLQAFEPLRFERPDDNEVLDPDAELSGTPTPTPTEAEETPTPEPTTVETTETVDATETTETTPSETTATETTAEPSQTSESTAATTAETTETAVTEPSATTETQAPTETTASETTVETQPPVETAPPTDTPTPEPTAMPEPTAAPEPPPSTGGLPSGYQNAAEAQKLLQLVNDYRAANGVGPLTWSSGLEAAAQIRSQEIATTNGFSHTRPDGTDYWTADSSLIYGENIAAGQATAEAVFEGWINSEGHRNNILNPGYVTMGVAMFNTSEAVYSCYWAQEFGY